jgi:hypothetical protein
MSSSLPFPQDWTEIDLINLARALHEVAAEHLRSPTPGHLSRWLHGPRYTDLFIDIAPGGDVANIELSYGGNWLRMGDNGITTGSTDELAIHHGQPASRTVAQDTVASPAVINGARCIFAHLADPQLRTMLLGKLPPAQR